MNSNFKSVNCNLVQFGDLIKAKLCQHIQQEVSFNIVICPLQVLFHSQHAIPFLSHFEFLNSPEILWNSWILICKEKSSSIGRAHFSYMVHNLEAMILQKKLHKLIGLNWKKIVHHQSMLEAFNGFISHTMLFFFF